jgi:hypothetical protein
MSIQFRKCDLEMDYEAYLRFLLRHHTELNLPYPFAVKLSFIGSPLLMGKALLAIDEDPYEIVAAIGFNYGTGAGGYEDRHICQIEVAFIAAAYRRTSLFRQGLRALLDTLRSDNPSVRQIQFWLSAEQEAGEPLFAKLARLPGAERSVDNKLVFCSIPFRELERYTRRIP